MGCSSSTPAVSTGAETPKSSKSAASSSSIALGEEDLLKSFNVKEPGKMKMLLLGAGECGKSTIFKQMRLLYGTKRSEEEIEMYSTIVRTNILEAIRLLIVHLRTLGLVEELDKESEGNCDDDVTPKKAFDELAAHLVDKTAGSFYCVRSSKLNDPADARGASMFLKYHKIIQILWQSNTMKQVWARRAEVNVIDSHKNFLDDIPRIAAENYKATTQDILYSRVKTTEVIINRFNIEGIDFEILDVGGQKVERRKWASNFDQVNAVVFVAALSEYDQMLAEQTRTNRMMEALDLFKMVSDSPDFENTPIILFLNKKDIFGEKIMYSNIADQKQFSDYTGPAKDYDAGVKYFTQRFKNTLVDGVEDSFIHITCATDTGNMEFVLSSTKNIIVTENMNRIGFLGVD